MTCPDCGNVLRPVAGTDILHCIRCQEFFREDDMPKGSKVEKCYSKVKAKTGDAGKAARICQSATGQSLQTGKAPKGKGK